MNSTKDLIDGVVPGFKYEKPDVKELKMMSDSMNLDLSEAECEGYSVEIRNMKGERDACSACKSLETCPFEITGYITGYRGRGFGGSPSFMMAECARLKQFRETQKNERLLEYCKIPPVLRLKTFKNYDRKENPIAVAIAADFIQGNRTKGAIFYGPTGVGKTHLAAAILNNRIIGGQNGIYATVPDLMDSLRSAMRNERLEDARAALIETEVLFLDDIGAENPTEFVTEELFKIINGRWLNGRVIIGTSNLTPEGIKERYAGLGGQRIFSRLSELCDWVEMAGTDHRL